MLKNALTLMLAPAVVAPVYAAVDWMTDLDAAKAKAAAENKAVLVSFTGSDWCSLCIQLKKDVLTQPDFESYLAENFILVVIDVPDDASLVGGQEQLQKNQQLSAQYGVEGYPTVMVLTPDGQIVGGLTGYADKDSARESVNVALLNARTLQEAATLPPAEKSARMLEVYGGLKQDFPEAAVTLGAEIFKLQPDNEQLKAELELAAIKAKFAAIPEDDYETILAKLDEEIATAMPVNQDLLKRSKAAIVELLIVNELYASETVEDVLAARKRLLEEVVPLMPQERQAEMKSEIETELADPQKVLDALKTQREEESANTLSETEMEQLQAVMERVEAHENDPEAALRILDEALATAAPVMQTHLTSWKVSILLELGQRMADTAETVEDVQQIRELAIQLIQLTVPDEEERAAALKEIEEQFADPEAVLEQFKQQRH